MLAPASPPMSDDVEHQDIIATADSMSDDGEQHQAVDDLLPFLYDHRGAVVAAEQPASIIASWSSFQSSITRPLAYHRHHRHHLQFIINIINMINIINIIQTRAR